MRSLIAAALFLAIFIPSPLAADADCVPLVSRDSMTDVRHGIPPTGIAAKLIQNPQPVTPVTFADERNGQPGFWSSVDYHALYPVELSYFTRSITDLPNEAQFVPHMTESIQLCASGTDPIAMRQRARFDFDYVFYKTSCACVLAGYSGKSGNGVFFDYQSEGVPEGSCSFFAGSWYLEAVTLDGKSYTYARYHLVTCLRDLPGIVKFVIRAFPGTEIPATMNAYFNHAKALRDADAGRR